MKLQTKQKKSTKQLTMMGILGAMAVILFYTVEFPVPFMPPFLKLDISDLPVLIGGFLYGPASGVLLAFVKALLHLFKTQTMGVGELADFLGTTALVFPASYIYSKNKTIKRAVWGMGVGILAMTVVAFFANMFILIPFYSNIMPIEAIIEACNKVNPLANGIFADSLNGYYVCCVIPFNLFKGFIICLVTFLVYKRISRFVK